MAIKSCIIGFGSIAAQNIFDPVMSKNYRCSSHLQAILRQKGIELNLILESSAKSRLIAKKMTNKVEVYDKPDKAEHLVNKIELLILTTPPEKRLEFIDSFPNLKSIVVEKPLGVNLSESLTFCKKVKKKKIYCAVNYWRRYVKQFIKLKNGGLQKILGRIQSVISIYGNGIRNNGIHLIDFSRFLFGEISSLELNRGFKCNRSPIKNDLNIEFSGFFKSGISFKFIPIDFSFYRDNGLQIIGEKGILSILNDSRIMFLNKTRKNRGISNFNEVNFSKNNFINIDYDLALPNLYKEIVTKDNCNSPIENALLNEKIVHNLVEKHKLS